MQQRAPDLPIGRIVNIAVLTCALPKRLLRTSVLIGKAHINNLYNTAFWALIQQGGSTAKEAHATLSVGAGIDAPAVLAVKQQRPSPSLTHSLRSQGTVSAQKHEILFSRFGINYNDLDALYRRGSILLREELESAGSTPTEAAAAETTASKPQSSAKKRKTVLPLRMVHEDMLKDKWWTETRPGILGAGR